MTQESFTENRARLNDSWKEITDNNFIIMAAACRKSGLGRKEAAEAMGVSISTAARRLDRACELYPSRVEKVRGKLVYRGKVSELPFRFNYINKEMLKFDTDERLRTGVPNDASRRSDLCNRYVYDGKEGLHLLFEPSYYHKVAFKVFVKIKDKNGKATDIKSVIAVPVGNEYTLEEGLFVDMLVQCNNNTWIHGRKCVSDIERVEKIDYIELPEEITKHAGKSLISVEINHADLERIKEAMKILGLDHESEEDLSNFVSTAVSKKLRSFMADEVIQDMIRPNSGIYEYSFSKSVRQAMDRQDDAAIFQLFTSLAERASQLSKLKRKSHSERAQKMNEIFATLQYFVEDDS